MKFRIPYYVATGMVVPIGSGFLPTLEEHPRFDRGTMAIFETGEAPSCDENVQSIKIEEGRLIVFDDPQKAEKRQIEKKKEEILERMAREELGI